jgi:altronate dehydratase small subunit
LVSSAIIIDAKDNVATVLRPLNDGESIGLDLNNRSLKVILRQNIPFGHKVALRDIRKGEAVIKYGEVIGLATAAIYAGELVHVHNVEGRKGRGDKV